MLAVIVYLNSLVMYGNQFKEEKSYKILLWLKYVYIN